VGRYRRNHRSYGLGNVELTEMKQRSPRRPSVTSIVKQATKAGVVVARIEVEPSGKIIIVTGTGDSADVTANPWDSVLAGNGRRDGP
jgi:hypothetical protein